MPILMESHVSATKDSMKLHQVSVENVLSEPNGMDINVTQFQNVQLEPHKANTIMNVFPMDKIVDQTHTGTDSCAAVTMAST